MLKMNNWEEWQTFRKDRGAPPWIKLHRNLMTCPKWASLTDSEKGQLISIWIVAADKNGQVSKDPTLLMKICMLDKKPNINKFIELGLMTTTCQPPDNHEIKPCPQVDAPEERRVEESRVETEEIRVEKSKNNSCSNKDNEKRILSYLNIKTGKQYKPVDSNLSLITQRLNEGHTVDDCYWVIDEKSKEWLTDEKFNKYLRPATLFNASKFNSYIGEKGSIRPLSEKEKFYRNIDSLDTNDFIDGDAHEAIGQE